MTPFDPTRAHRVSWCALALVLLGLGVWTLREFLPALIWAAILTVAIWPAYQRARRRWPPGPHNLLLPGLFTLAIALVFVLPVVVVGIQASREARAIVAWIETARTGGLPVPDAIANLPTIGAWAAQWWREHLSGPEAVAELLARAKSPEFLETGRHLGAAILHRAVIFGFCLTTVFFLLKDGDRVATQLTHAGNRAFGPVGERVGRQIVASIHGTVDGLVLVGLAEGVLLYIVYLFVGVPHPALLGVATAIGAMIPFGAPVAFGLAALLTAGSGSNGGAIAIVVAGIVVTFVADHFFRPVLIGNATKLPFIWVLFGILGGVTTWGLLGLFLGPAIMAALILLWREWTETA